METTKPRTSRREKTAKVTAIALGLLLSALAFGGYREYAARREQATVRQLRESVRSSRSDLITLVPAAMELNYHAQIVWTYCLLPGRPEISRVRQRAHASVLKTLEREEQSTAAVVRRAIAVKRARRVWRNPGLRRDYIRLAARLRYQAENAGTVLASVTRTRNTIAKL